MGCDRKNWPTLVGDGRQKKEEDEADKKRRRRGEPPLPPRFPRQK